MSEAGGELPSELKLWDLATRQEVLTLRQRKACALDVAFSPDGGRLATADADHLITLWEGRDPSREISLARQARSLVGRLFDRAPRPSLGEVQDRIQADPTIIDDLRRAAMDAAVTMAGDIVRKEAEDLVHSLLSKALSREEVLSSLRSHATLGADLRRQAIWLAERLPEKPWVLDSASRAVVHRRDASPQEYLLARRRAETACRLVPVEGRYWTTLGMACYRLNQHQAAVEALEKADALNTAPDQGPMPADLAFLALASHRLGREDLARAAYRRLQDVIKRPEWASNGEARAFFHEAETVFDDAQVARKGPAR